MTDAELLRKINIAFFGNDAGDWRNDTLQIYIDEVREFMRDAGVPEDVLGSKASVGCIIMGVNDLWNYSSGGARFSDYFEKRVIQLAKGAERK